MSSLGILGNVGQSAAAGAAGGKAAGAANSSESAVQWFQNYMKETPAQRFEDSWLAAHGLTQKQLDAMSPQQRQAVMQQMANDMKQQLEQKTRASLASTSQITAS